MKIVFFGTPFFAATNLNALINAGHDIVAVISPPDSRKGRGKELKPCAVKEVAVENNIPVLQPLKLRSEHFITELKTFNADLFVVVAFRMLPESVWKLPKKGTINLHTSLLPNYRGAAPINWVLINGEKETGITTFFIDRQIDSGAIIKQEKIALTDKTTAAELHNTLMNKGSQLLIKTLDSIKENSVNQNPQQHNSVMLEAPKLTKELLKIDWSKPAKKIHNLVRGLSPFLNSNTKLKDISICPSAWFILQDDKGVQKRIKVHLSKVVSSNSKKLLNLRTDNKTYLHIITTKHAIAILNLQVSGKNPMTIQQFLQGNKINENYSIL
ncbi:MAG: methionyl-tRNA formyltransferase [Flavobacteriales bacterium]|jgi:methionyl-tRNA formyltransferase|nr:methionyl-tRNA formyltransferase [Flavobacteriales bacterium]